MSAFAEEVLTDSLERLLQILHKPKLFNPSHPNQFRAALAATAAAHGTEILIKSAIANEHPLLQFESRMYNRSIPSNDTLELEHLFDNQTIQFQNLPYALWASTGYKLPLPDIFEEFRRLRNKLQHFTAPPNEIILDKTLDFLFGVADPVLRHFWANDLLSLIRPFGVLEIVKRLEQIGVAYSVPGWISTFDPNQEQKELEELKRLAQKQEEFAVELNRRVTPWFVHMSLIIPRESVAAARREVIRITGNPAEKHTFSVPLSPSGSEPATHFGAHTAATLDIASFHIRLLHRYGGFYNFTRVFSGTPYEEHPGSFNSLLEELQLKRISHNTETL